MISRREPTPEMLRRSMPSRWTAQPKALGKREVGLGIMYGTDRTWGGWSLVMEAGRGSRRLQGT